MYTQNIIAYDYFSDMSKAGVCMPRVGALPRISESTYAAVANNLLTRQGWSK